MSQREEILADSDEFLDRMMRGNGKAHNDDTHIAPVDVERLIGGLQLELASVSSRLADKDRSDSAQTTLMLQTIGKYVAEQLKPLQDEIAKLEAQVAELQESGAKFCGTYQRANSYRRGEWVGYDGSGWVALTEIQPLEAPGASPKWQLVIRVGKDGRDAHDDDAANPAEPRKRCHRDR